MTPRWFFILFFPLDLTPSPGFPPDDADGFFDRQGFVTAWAPSLPSFSLPARLMLIASPPTELKIPLLHGTPLGELMRWQPPSFSPFSTSHQTEPNSSGFGCLQDSLTRVNRFSLLVGPATTQVSSFPVQRSPAPTRPADSFVFWI